MIISSLLSSSSIDLIYELNFLIFFFRFFDYIQWFEHFNWFFHICYRNRQNKIELFFLSRFFWFFSMIRTFFFYFAKTQNSKFINIIYKWTRWSSKTWIKNLIETTTSTKKKAFQTTTSFLNKNICDYIDINVVFRKRFFNNFIFVC